MDLIFFKKNQFNPNANGCIFRDACGKIKNNSCIVPHSMLSFEDNILFGTYWLKNLTENTANWINNEIPSIGEKFDRIRKDLCQSVSMRSTTLPKELLNDIPILVEFKMPFVIRTFQDVIKIKNSFIAAAGIDPKTPVYLHEATCSVSINYCVYLIDVPFSVIQIAIKSLDKCINNKECIPGFRLWANSTPIVYLNTNNK